MKPFGHLGFSLVTFFIALPFTQVIVDFVTVAVAGEALAVGVGEVVGDAVGEGEGDGDGATAFSCFNRTCKVGEEKVKPYAPSINQPFAGSSLRTVVSTISVSPSLEIEISATTGASV